jgi:hypothetical protein
MREGVATAIYNSIEIAVEQRADIAIAVATQLFDRPCETDFTRAAVQQRDLAACSQRSVHHMSAQEYRATKNEKFHGVEHNRQPWQHRPHPDIPIPMQTRVNLAAKQTATQIMVISGARWHAQRDRHRSIVDEVHLHVGRKDAGLHLAMLAARRSNEPFIQASAILRRSGRGKTGPVATAYVRGQRELTDDEQATRCTLAIQVLHAAVHLALGVAEDAQFQNLGQQPVALGRRVTLLSADQHQQTRANRPYRSPFNIDTSATDALQDRDHKKGLKVSQNIALQLPKP